ncbi:TetR/AcrR family transcriptional regulator [Microbacterium thalassium]|uniref:AcrR family transcriptional regulator n=1 Tax=Microbacterium thalassium TaxID=362649 RepID=A0A7X0KTV3_9MICO|nr:TetR/AcrR family transcriptional regulator [Microbacterium thalassium]MBB6390497.1 AcrR family transcriptional regulator [Microbacterium thalassium]GLK25607.1 TetR family transcriptional regulator [Microbacterium thalassium]
MTTADEPASVEAAPIDDWRDYSADALPPELAAALECFVESGFHGTTVRVIAARAGLSVAGYYHHHPSKEATLVAVMRSAMADLYARTLAADAEAGADPVRRLTSHVECLVLFHAHRGDLAFIAASEIRSLGPQARAEHIAERDRQQAVLESIVHEGVLQGVFSVAHERDAVRALVTMCTGVSQWYRSGGGLEAEELAAEYVELARRMLGVR